MARQRMARQQQARDVYSIEDVMTKLDIGQEKAYRMARARVFPTLRVGKRILIPKKQWDEWFERIGDIEDVPSSVA
jgi:excisionase family DNA binding protein